MVKFYLEFEKPIVELERKISELSELSKSQDVDFQDEIKKLERKTEKLIASIFAKLSPWERTQLSRHAERPYTLDYIDAMFTDFIELHGDRNYSDDAAIVGGFARFNGRSVMVLGHQKGRSTKEKVRRNFGMPRPEGYRKALRLMSMAERYRLPIITFIDTPGAYPGIGAEERGQAEAIAKNIMVMSVLKVPIISLVIGEGGSGGALAIGVSDRILMLEYSIYSVISPESCAAILWRDSSKGEIASRALKLTAPDIVEMGIGDELIPEPMGGAHRNFPMALEGLKKSLDRNLNRLVEMTPDQLLQGRYEKYRKMGFFTEPPASLS